MELRLKVPKKHYRVPIEEEEDQKSSLLMTFITYPRVSRGVKRIRFYMRKKMFMMKILMERSYLKMMRTIATITLRNQVHCKIYFEMINAPSLLNRNLKIFLQKLRVSRYHKIIKNLEMFKILKFAQNLFLSKDFLFCPSTNLRCKSLMSILVLPKELAILFKQSSSQNSWSISKV